MLKGTVASEETKRKMSEAKKRNPVRYWLGKHMPESAKKKMSKSKKGKKLSEEHKRKISEGCKGKSMGEKNGAWRNGASLESYSAGWTRTLKRKIRERDHYICQFCGKLQDNKTFHVHHVDYNKKNCKPENLITLCHKCHNKTINNRDKYLRNVE